MAKIYLLSNQKHEDVQNIEIFKIEYIKSYIDLKKYDALVFTSKNGVYSLNSFNNDWKNIPSYAIAEKTAKIINKEGGNVKFIGQSGHGNDFAKELIPLLKDKKVLYIRALKVVSNLVETLKNANINIDELTTYKTVCNDNIKEKIEKNSSIIFTSPSSIECFFKIYTWDKSFKAIVIGKTTAKYLPDYVDFKISNKTSIEECIKLAMLDSF
ncbi:uroporphyrinogen-III synthase [Halarcobacter sp.]|uniref:uroporphyrinogen-III synthase n=1 Tax=Halarcobacter sp. TaxID=2321133 RepID=UPI002AA86B7C|nr:uroporphyrinogen-III synthase [Halarcobacter sp.]